MPDRLARALRALWAAHPALTAVALAMLPVLAASAVGIVVDPRRVTGAPAWLKPAKFAASIAIYSLTMAWIVGLLRDAWPRLTRRAGNVVAAMFALEIVVIVVQAARGHASHFNVATPLDATLFSVMGTGILVQTLAAATIAVAAFRTTFADRAAGEAVRWGLVLSLAAASIGAFMTRPTAAQLDGIHAGARPTAIGAHTVGAPDGGAGLPGLGWSTQHGDLRVGHFFGLHALQALPLLAWVLARRRVPQRERAAVVRIAAGAWGAVTLTLVWQALRGVPLLAADAPTALALGAIAVLTFAAAAIVLRRPGHAPLVPSRS
ncbi:MAG: hypothetical protein JO180_09875 [Gemmatirosa sp.]|nr:hypothetical protein [Gemmatirosa sp.]